MLRFNEVGRLLEGYIHSGEMSLDPQLSEEQDLLLSHIFQAIPHGVYARLDQEITFFLQEEYRLKEFNDQADLKNQKLHREELRELLSKEEELRPYSGIRGEMSSEVIASFLVADFISLAKISP